MNSRYKHRVGTEGGILYRIWACIKADFVSILVCRDRVGFASNENILLLDILITGVSCTSSFPAPCTLRKGALARRYYILPELRCEIYG